MSLEILAPIVGLLAAIVGGFLLRLSGRRAGRREQQERDKADALDRIKRGQDAVSGGRAGGGDPDERLRDNDGRW